MLEFILGVRWRHLGRVFGILSHVFEKCGTRLKQFQGIIGPFENHKENRAEDEETENREEEDPEIPHVDFFCAWAIYIRLHLHYRSILYCCRNI
jgi:hypothetical protein